MVPFEVLTCPCCTAAMVHALTQAAPDLLAPRAFLQLGKGALVTAIGHGGKTVKSCPPSYLKRSV